MPHTISQFLEDQLAQAILQWPRRVRHIRRRPNLPDHETSVKAFAQELKVLADATQVGGAKEGDVFTGPRKFSVRFTVNGGSQGVQKW